MSHGKKKRKGPAKSGPDAPELNIMPFIDIFSMLNTFLLVSASFLGLGILEVQVPFLSNSPEVKEEPQRSFSLRVDIDPNEIIIKHQWTAPPVEVTETKFELNDAGIVKFHDEMVAVRKKVPENDKVTLYAGDDVNYEKFIKVLDAIKTMGENEPPLDLPVKRDEDAPKPRGRGSFLFEKVVVGNVLIGPS